MRLTALALLLVGVPLHLEAQPRTRPQPAVDPLTATISGRITTADNGAPIRGAEVRAVSDAGVNRLAATDAEGRYELRDLPAGTFRVAVSKSGFAPGQFGQRRPTDSAAAIQLSQGERFTANITLLRGGVIAGRVFDRYGEPVAGVRVQALRPRMIAGRRGLYPVGLADETDDRGAFRVYGLAPDDYYVAATERRANDFPQRGDIPIYYPGTADFTQAQRITVTAATESNAMIQLAAVSTATVSGMVLGPNGAPDDATVTLTSDLVALGNSGQGPVSFSMSTHAEVDGTFTLSDVPPGPYTLRADSVVLDVSAKGVMTGHLIGTVPLSVTSDISGLNVSLGAGGTITGSFVRDSAASGELPERLGISVNGPAMMRSTGPRNTFRLSGVHGRVRLAADGLPDGWTVKSILANGEDVTDTGIDVTSGTSTNVRIVVTDRVTEVSGTITSRAPLGTQTVLVFAEDPGRWTYPSRFVRTARVDDRGRFSLAGLPPERYLAVALEFLEDGDSQDPEVLERLRQETLSFSLSEGERRTLDLRSIDR